MRDCNPCKCASDGLSYSCTHNECLETEADKDKEVEVFMQSEGQDHIERHSVCRASNTFYIGCNTCRCNRLGTDYSCTNKPCPLPADVELFHELKDLKPAIPYGDIDHDLKAIKL
ncbi:serine protease inhibitor I/II-like [Helicoverpa zea]|uniref:serine protease inhibitor I/II-like n=1 Tax=Helicoverpa zea TaxID=7113 RepID=UPI001F596087|nr:serine protease inhibitor I/II-like [Helicoverpa zea]